ncbi:MAG: prepilin-type N-terminal cleavage/methylation domain-containing protein [Patescibacteria group bacterium]
MAEIIFTYQKKRRGLSLIEVIIAIGLISLLFGAIYASYVSIIDVVTNSGVRTEAATIAANEIEIIRNLPYDQVGIVGGIPSGVLLPTKAVASTNGLAFALETYVRNIDDSFDSTLGGTPNDTSPSDYKLVELSIRCTSCARSVPLIMTTTVAPKNLESAASDGSLFVTVIDASGLPVATATVQIINASVVPSINLTDITNGSGVLQLIGAPTSTQGYEIRVSKEGYSSEQTYAIGDPENPTPLSQYTHASVAAQTLSSKTFSIDRLSSATFKTMDTVCRPVASQAFTLAGSKTIGTDTIKFSSSSGTDLNGEKIWGNLEWDIYTATLTGSGYDIAGIMPASQFTLDPDEAENISFILTSTDPNSLLVEVRDGQSGQGIASSTIILSQSGFSETKKTARSFITETDWSSGTFDSQDGGIDATSVPGTVRLVNGGTGYSTTTTSWLISQSLDIGSSTGNFYTVNWNPESQSSGASLGFQIASNNDNATWDFTGPDGTVNTFYTNSGETISPLHSGHRYLRYKVFMSTTDETVTPVLSDVSLEFYGICVPSAQALFQDLGTGSYTLDVSAPGYSATSTSVSVGSGSNDITVLLMP